MYKQCFNNNEAFYCYHELGS